MPIYLFQSKGTGKTYVGLRIAQALLLNNRYWSQPVKSPMLVVCYTNHALDQFLEGIYSFQKNIVRIGGKSKCATLEAVNLSNIRKEQKSNRSVPHHIFQARVEANARMTSYQNQIARIEEQTEYAIKNVLTEELSMSVIELKETHYAQLAYAGFSESILVFIGLEKRKRIDGPWLDDDDNHENVTENASQADGKDQVIEENVDEEEIKYLENMRFVDGNDDDVENDNKPINRPSARKKERRLQFYVQSEDNDGFQLSKEDKKKRKRNIQRQLRSDDCMSEDEAREVKSVWALKHNDRWRLYRLWVKIYIVEMESNIKDLRRAMNLERNKFAAAQNQEDIEICKKFDVIGMTTTGAAKYHHIIDGTKPRIMSMYNTFL